MTAANVEMERAHMKRLPDDIKQEINRLAHALAQWSFTEHRRRLEAEALALLRAGCSLGEVLQDLGANAVPGRK